MSGQPVCCGWNPRPRNGSRPRYSGNPGNQKPKEGARISQPRSTKRDGAGLVQRTKQISESSQRRATDARRHSINRIRRPVEMSPRPDAAKRPDEPVSPNNQPRPELREPAKTQQPGLHKNEEPLDQQQAHRIGGGHHCHAGDPVAFADHGDRDELERLYQADGHGQQRERLIRSQSLDRAPKLSRPLPDPTRNQCGISLDKCVFFAL